MGTRSTGEWLLALCDPEADRVRLPARPPGRRGLRRLIDLADRHGVLAAAAANLRRAAEADGPARVVRAPAPADALAAALADAGERLAPRRALTMMIRRQTAEIAEAFARRDVPAAVVKGEDFADRLYPDPSLRPFTDLDLLCPRAAMPQAEAALAELGYRPVEPGMKYDEGYGESRWVGAAGGRAQVELHWNLVNSPTLRRGLSVEWRDVQLEGPPVGGGLQRVSSASQLLVAAVHAAASHAFDRLWLLCDVRQWVRTAGGGADADWLTEAARRTGAGLALAAALGLTGRLLDEPGCAALAERLGAGGGRLWRLLLTRGVVLRAGAGRDSFRRQIFRQMLKSS